MSDVAAAHPCCKSRGCKEKGCSFPLPKGRKRQICLSGTSIQSNHNWKGRLCDCIVFSELDETAYVYLLEMKGSDFGNALDQLEGGLKFVESVIEASTKVNLLLAAAATNKKRAIKLVQQKRLYFRGQGHTVILTDCNTPVEAISVRSARR